MHGKPMDFHLRKYRPKAKRVVRTLLKRFCMRCGRIRSIGRAGSLLSTDRCGGCPVFEALQAVDPRLKWIRSEMRGLENLLRGC